MFKIIKSFFCNHEGKFNPPYFWITVLITLVVAMVIMRMWGNKGDFSDTLILGVLGLVVGWCAVYNTGKMTSGKITEKIKKEIKDIAEKVVNDKGAKKK